MPQKMFITVCAGLLASSAMGQTLALSDQTDAANLTGTFALLDPSIFTSPIMRMSAGAAAGDFNNDGWQDLFIVCGGAIPDLLYINDGDGTFTDRADEWNIDVNHYGVCPAVGDYNNDGWLDIFVTSLGVAPGLPQTGQHRLYRNNGNGTFSEVAAQAFVTTTSTGVPDGNGATFGDMDLDGDLDLAVAGWSIGSGGNRLFENKGDGTFIDVTVSAILTDMTPVRGFSPRFCDMNGDRYPELLWVADFVTSRYLVNNGNGTFSDQTGSSGTGIDLNGMGNTVADYDGDQRLDWYVTSILYPEEPFLSGNMLYMNQGDHSYVENSIDAQVNDGRWGWGVVSVDLDHDRDVDIFETNGWYDPPWLDQTDRVFLNDGTGAFAESHVALGLTAPTMGRGLVSFDADNDGDQDLYRCQGYSVISSALPHAFIRNDLSGPSANWLRIFLDTRATPWLAPNGVGSVVRLTAGGTTQIRVIDGGCNYESQSELSAHFGLAGDAVVDELTIEWPDGTVSAFSDVPANRTLTIDACPADRNDDEVIDIADLLDMLASWFTLGSDADLNLDQIVAIDDLLAFLASWFNQGC